MFDKLTEQDKRKYFWYLFVTMPIAIIAASIILLLISSIVSFRISLGGKLVVALSFVVCYIYSASRYYHILSKKEEER